MLAMIAGCKKDGPTNNPITPGQSAYQVDLSTDKAAYYPGDRVMFTISKTIPGTVKVRYRRQSTTLREDALTGTSWEWVAPSDDYTGYLVDLYERVGDSDKVYGSIAVDVSSDWAKFPRYGFLSAFGQMSTAAIEDVVANLNRHHINGLQFQDWHFKHHQPLAGSAANPADNWKDIANRDNYRSTVNGYISAAHNRNMKAMFYNLAMGALNDAAADGVQEQWYMFKDRSHGVKDLHPLPKPPFKSDIYLTDPSNAVWQQYLAARNNDVYSVFDFDGFHIDQLGDRGAEYDYAGNSINLAAAYLPFVEAMKAASPGRQLVMNAVNQYGQQNSIAASPVDFLYTEVWSPNEGYKDLATIIQNNDLFAGGLKKTVLAAYMDYAVADNQGWFNTPGVLLTDAVIFAFGGAHLELGEHMLGKEYFPNNNLQMKDDLKQALVRYYDFMVAYQNLLRDGGTFTTAPVSCTNGKLLLNNWPPQSGSVSVVAKDLGNKQVLHLINFANAAHLNWRDTNGNQTMPLTIQNAAIQFTSAKPVTKIWVASPDTDHGVAHPVAFTQNGNTVNFNLPVLQYWDMVVIEN
ncbi:putative glycosidase [Flavihumibacter petaseus NBRC 106054]|uniref:Putative glycosidase n=2 Tax=Flavihumibacter TaxID=1004301 RepID=A0A0E9N6N6_9BACT|nr:putative glycosidase [Flavihumibacter petaseus NBRC 106054]